MVDQRGKIEWSYKHGRFEAPSFDRSIQETRMLRAAAAGGAAAMWLEQGKLRDEKVLHERAAEPEVIQQAEAAEARGRGGMGGKPVVDLYGSQGDRSIRTGLTEEMERDRAAFVQAACGPNAPGARARR